MGRNITTLKDLDDVDMSEVELENILLLPFASRV